MVTGSVESLNTLYMKMCILILSDRYEGVLSGFYEINLSPECV